MRDLVLTLFVLGSVPMMVYRPFIGLLFWMWLGFMNPHRLTWGWAYSFPFVQVAAIATLLGMVLARDHQKLPRNSVTAIWILLILWTTITTLFALNPDLAWAGWWQFMKIQIMILVMMLLLNSKSRIWWTVVVVAASICFYGVKGGIFTIAKGGQHMVLGPQGSFIGGNTEIALAIVVVLPLLWWIRGQLEQRWMRMSLALAFGLCVLAVLGSYSRGAVLAVSAMMAFLWLRSKGKLLTGFVAIVVIGIGLSLMPDKWFDRMGTIGGELDKSEQGRINAWGFAFNLANDRPLVGGGFRVFTPELFQRYAPDPDDFHDAHSIFFEVLAEQGYVGLLLFLLLGVTSVIYGWRTERLAAGTEELDWARQLVRMCQVSLVGYIVGGLFLGLAYFDLPYAIAAIIVATGTYVRKQLGVLDLKSSVSARSYPKRAGLPSKVGQRITQ